MLLAPSISGLFKWRQFEPEVILLAVGWYLRFSLSYREVEELLVGSVCSTALLLVCLELKSDSYAYRTQAPSIP